MRKFEDNWKYKSLENLEKEIWPTPGSESHLERRINHLRKVPLYDLSIEDLRIMIGQNFGLAYLIPLAIDELEQNILAEGDCYPGDLLNAVVKIDSEFWKNHTDHKARLDRLLKENWEELPKSLTKHFREGGIKTLTIKSDTPSSSQPSIRINVKSITS